jgi:hypothetical protein
MSCARGFQERSIGGRGKIKGERLKEREIKG